MRAIGPQALSPPQPPPQRQCPMVGSQGAGSGVAVRPPPPPRTILPALGSSLGTLGRLWGKQGRGNIYSP